MHNPVPSRVAEFLREIAPFSLLQPEVLGELCQKVVIRYALPPEFIFREGDAPGRFVYIVHEGSVILEAGSGEHAVLQEQCGEGDLFGIRPVVAGDQYQLSARVAEETLLYQVGVEDLKQIMQNHPEVSWYLAQHFAGRVYRNFQIPPGKGKGPGADTFMELSSITFSKSPITCAAGTTIRDAATKMRTHNIGSMIVADSRLRPIGILTDRDLRNLVVTGDVPGDQPVGSIMSSPVITKHPQATLAEVQIAMLRNQVHHILLTEDGTPESRVVGVVSEHDLLVQQGYHPAILLREARRCVDGEGLRRIRSQAERWMQRQLAQGTGIALVAEVMTEVNDALTTRAIDLSFEKLDLATRLPGDLRWCWLSLGSGGRGEQLLRTDQDHALVFLCPEDCAPEPAREQLLRLAREASTLLESCGYTACPSDMMASNARWCNTLTEWKGLFSGWIREPTESHLMYSSIFFDFRPVCGDKDLALELAGHIRDEIREKEIFLHFLAKAAIHTPPPLTFFRHFLVEKKGDHRDQFDLKARALMPLVDAARVLILAKGEPTTRNTGERFGFLAREEPQNRELFEQASSILEFLLRLRTEQGLIMPGTGRYIDPKELGRIDRLLLRNSFRVISDLQELIRVRFQLSVFM
jgi:CBS domain-containing protein